MARRTPTLSEQVRCLAKLKRTASEELGLPINHIIFRHLDRLEKHWDHGLYQQVQRCLKRLRAERDKLDCIGHHIPPQGVFDGGDVFLGEAPTPHGTPTRVIADSNDCPTHWLVPGAPGVGKTTFVRVFLKHLVAVRPEIAVIIWDPVQGYAELCRDPATWVNIAWHEVRINPLRAPVGYLYELWKPQKADALGGRSELLHGRYLVLKRLDRQFEEAGVPERDDGKCPVPSLFDLRDDLARNREKPGSRDEGYRAAALNLIEGRIRTTGGHVYDCARGMEDYLTSTRVHMDMHGLSPPESVEFFETSLIHHLYCRRSLEPLVEPPVLDALSVAEEAQVLLGRHAHTNIALYQEILLKSRSQGTGFLFVVQDLEDIDRRVLSAISNFAIFRQASATNKRLARDLLDLSPREAELLGRLPTGECFVKMGGHKRWPFPFLMRVIP